MLPASVPDGSSGVAASMCNAIWPCSAATDVTVCRGARHDALFGGDGMGNKEGCFGRRAGRANSAAFILCGEGGGKGELLRASM